MGLVEIDLKKTGVGLLTLNDPDRLNAMSLKMAEEFQQHVQALKAESQLKALVITGAGRAFSAGGDLSMLEQKTRQTEKQNEKEMLDFYHSFLSVRELQVPLIAAINGHAIGAGLGLACACDIRLVNKSAKLGANFLRLGIHPGMGTSYLMPQIVGSSAAMDLLLSGRIVQADEALQIGLVSRVVNQEMMEAVQDYLTNCGQATRDLLLTLRESKGLEAALEREASCQSRNFLTKEFSNALLDLKNR